MYRFIGVLLVEDSDGKPHVVTAPAYKAAVGQLATFDGNIGKVVKCATVDPDSEEYAIMSAMIPMHEADGLYYLRYEKGDEDAS